MTKKFAEWENELKIEKKKRKLCENFWINWNFWVKWISIIIRDFDHLNCFYFVLLIVFKEIVVGERVVVTFENLPINISYIMLLVEKSWWTRYDYEVNTFMKRQRFKKFIKNTNPDEKKSPEFSLRRKISW